MPYASKKQQKYFHTKEGMKKVGMKVVKEFDKESKGKTIPNKLKKNK